LVLAPEFGDHTAKTGAANLSVVITYVNREHCPEVAVQERTRPSARFLATCMNAVLQGCDDLKKGASNWRLCHLIGTRDLRQRYTRSRIGQFWLTISMGLMIGGLGFLWSTVFKMPAADLMPHVAAGFVVWMLISGVLGEATSVFISTA